MNPHSDDAKRLVLIRRKQLLTFLATLAILLMAPSYRLGAQGAGSTQSGGAHKSGPPGCAQPLPGLAVPNGPHGLFAVFFAGNQFTSEADEYLLHNPTVCGGLFYIIWSDVDKGPGASPRYEWSVVDRQIEPWIQAGKRVALVVWAVGYGGREVTPSWVLSQVDSVRCEYRNPNQLAAGRFPRAGGASGFPGARPPFGRRPGFGRPGGQFPGGVRGGQESPPIPVYWENGFMKNYQEFAAAVVHKYGSNPSVAYIRIGLGAGGESTPRCHQQMERYGYSIEKWKQYVFDMMDFEKSLHSPKTLMVGFTNPEGRRFHEFPQVEAERAVQDGLGIGSQGLEISDVQDYRAGRPCGMVDWCAIFETYKGRTPLELQTLFKSNPDGNGPVGSLVDILPLGLEIHAQIFEIYAQDWLIAYDPQFPGYQQYHEAYQKALEQTAAVVGGR